MNRGMELLYGDQTGQASGSGALDGERKLVTVMFVDIAQSSSLVIGQDPEDADECLLAALQLMVDAVHRFGGTVNQVLGDGIMALFGAPRAQEDHALRACLAANAIHDATQRLTLPTDGDGPQGISVRVGISSGEVVIREPRGDFDLKLRITGEIVYQAQRLEAAAPAGVTLLGRGTLALTAGAQVWARPFGEVMMVAGGEPMEALELAELKVDHRQFRFLSSNRQGSFIGRSQDLQALRRHLNQIEQGKGCTLIVSGDAGVGKSRLMFEFLASLRDQYHQVTTCSLLPVGATQPLTPTAQAVRRLVDELGIKRDKSPRNAVEELLSALGGKGEHAQSAVLEILGETADDPTWWGLDPPQRRQIAVETVAQLLCGVSRRLPLIVVFEDYQWADSETRLLADSLAERIDSARVLMIVTCRSHAERSWPTWPKMTELEIRPLSPNHSSEFLDALMGVDDELDGVKNRLIDKTQGNPFFIEECVRALGQSGSLNGLPGAYRLAIPIDELKIPATVHGVLAARIDSLPQAERTTLLSASVIGERLDVGLLRDVERLPRDELMARLSRLQEAGFLERTRILPNLEYSFRHQLIHDVAYGTLLKRKRRELHRTAMAAVERRRPAQLPGRIELLAHHVILAEDWPKAVAYCRRAGLRAQGKSANREAVRYFDHALDALDQLPESRRSSQRQVDLRLELVQSLLPLGCHDTASVHLFSAQRLASQIGDERRLANVAAAFVPYHWMRGNLDQAISKGQQALVIAERLGDLRCVIQAGTRLGGISLNRGDYRSACQVFSDTIEKIPDAAVTNRFGLLVVASAGNRTSLARALGELGSFSEAVRVGDEGIRIAEETGHVFTRAYAYLFVSHALLRKGDFDRSLPLLTQSFELCRQTQAKLLYPLSAASLGYAHVRMGDFAQGLELLESAAISAKEHNITFQLSHELNWLAEAHLLCGEPERALEHARRALSYARSHGERGGEAWALWLLGDIYASQGFTRGEMAEERLQAAHDIAKARQMRPLKAHIDLALGKLYSRRGSRTEADQKVQAALTEYRRLDMNYWLTTVDRELADISNNSAVLAQS